MPESNFEAILPEWNRWGALIAYILGSIGIIVYLAHLTKLAITKEFKARYDYINRNEIKLMWVACLFIIAAGVIYFNTLFNQTTILGFIVRIFVSIMLGLVVGVIVQNILKFYYPFYVEKRLKRLRYTPRVSPKTGKAMKLLSEDEEDVYLDEGMQAEEDAFSVDYDVWIDEESGYTKIEKYNGRLHALRCPECNYQTLKIVKEEIIKSPTESEEGELMKFYQCSYCGHKERKAFNIKEQQKGPDKSQVPV